MFSPEKAFDELLATLKQPETLNPAKSDPILYLIYPPEQALAVKRCIPRWRARLREEGFQVERVSLSALLWQIVDESGRWESWLAIEPEADPDEVNEAIRDVLRSDNRLVEEVARRLNAAPEQSVVFLTDTEALHPYFRTRTIETALHDRVKVPTVIFYPGRRSGQHGLHFLDFYPVDGNYRSTILGGI